MEQNSKTDQGGSKDPMDTAANIFLGICVLGILALVSWLGYSSIMNMKEDIATHNTTALVMRIVFEFLLLSAFLAVLVINIPSLKHSPAWIKAFLCLGLAGLFISISYVVMDKTTRRLPEFDENYWSAMQASCNGRGIDQAADYQPGPGIHKVVSITRDLYFLPYEWLPVSMAETEIVLCLGDAESTQIEFCRYTGSLGFSRYQIKRQASLVALRTGEVIAETTFIGGLPGGCPNQISGSGSDTGPDVMDEDILNWMRPFIER